MSYDPEAIYSDADIEMMELADAANDPEYDGRPACVFCYTRGDWTYDDETRGFWCRESRCQTQRQYEAAWNRDEARRRAEHKRGRRR